MSMTKGPYDFAARKAYYRKCTDESLAFATEDIRQVMAAWPDHPNGGWYADDAHTVAAEINRRAGAKPMACACGRPFPA